jgi:beta-glucanase (GH16 family)
MRLVAIGLVALVLVGCSATNTAPSASQASPATNVAATATRGAEVAQIGTLTAARATDTYLSQRATLTAYIAGHAATPTSILATPSATPPATPTAASTGSSPPEGVTITTPDSLHGALLFADDFNGTAVDTAKWAFIHDSDITGHAASWNDAACTVSGGSLHITAQVIDGVVSSCALWTQGKEAIPPYGYWEVRARIPAASGTWPAFWSLAYDRMADPSLEGWEIDTMEAIDHAPADQRAISWNLHIPTASGGDDDREQIGLGAEMYGGYHTYATSWSPGLLVWYVDGVERFRVADSKVPSMSQVAIIQMALGGMSGWLDTSQLPQTMDVDYIYIYAGP